MDHKKLAESELQHFRHEPWGFPGRRTSLERHLQEAGLDPEDIGTSKAELDALTVLGTKVKALTLVNRLRDRRDGSYMNLHNRLMSALKTGHVTLAEVGSSDAEVARLLRECALAQAKAILEYIRQNLADNLSYEWYFESLEGHLANGQLSPEDIGSSAQEISTLRRTATMNEATYHLQQLREGEKWAGDPDYHLRQLKATIIKSDPPLSPTEIGTDEKELERLASELA